MAMIDVSRHVNLKTLELKVKILTPMFLGGANGNAELRPAPFKAALRYWWRIIQGRMDENRLLEMETDLFGGVSGKPVKSRISVSVYGTPAIGIPEGNKLPKVRHPEAEKSNCKVDGPGYLAGMGVYHFKNGYIRKAILPGQEFSLKIGYPLSMDQDIQKIIYLLDRFGTIGARNRNGFGSFHFKGFTLNGLSMDNLSHFKSALKETAHPYPHCMTRDDKGITFWKMKQKEANNYEKLLRELSVLYINLRTSPFFKFNRPGPGNRHLLGYPVMNHNLKEWGGPGGRLPSQLRLMVKLDESGKPNGYILHIAHALPSDKQWFPDLPAQEEVWSKVHQFLDNNMQRVSI